MPPSIDLAAPTAAVSRPASGRHLLAVARRILAGHGEQARIQRDALAAFVVRVASAGIFYLSQIVLARWMGASEFGVYVFAWTSVLVLGGLAHLGLGMTAIRLLPAYKAEGRDDLARGLLSFGRLVALGVGALVTAIGLLVLSQVGDRLDAHRLAALQLALACVPFYALSDLQDGIGRGKGWMGVALLPPYIARPLLLIAAMAITHEAGLPMTAVTAAGAAIAATFGAVLIQTRLVDRRLAIDPGPGMRTRELRGWLTISMPLLLLYAAELALQNIDVMLVSALRPPAEAGMYFAASKTMALVMFVHYAVGSAAAHRISTLKTLGDEAALATAIRDAVRWTFYPSAAAAIALLTLGPALLWLFSPEFKAAYPVMVILSVGFLVRAAVGPAEFVLNMMGEQRRVAAIVAGAALLDLVLGLALVPRFGIIGAAIATATALVFAAVAQAVMARRRLGLSLFIGAHR